MALTSYQAPIGSVEQASAEHKADGGFPFDLGGAHNDAFFQTYGKMTPRQQERYHEEVKARGNAAIRKAQEAEIDKRIGESLQIAWDQIDRKGNKSGAYRLNVADGRVEKLNQQGVDWNATMGGYVATDINTIDLDFGGTVLSQDNARDMLDQGVISEAQFVDAVERSMHKVQPSFVLTQKAFERLAYRTK